jgi:hypothetical protein
MTPTEAGNDVIGHHASLGGRRVPDRRYDLKAAVLHRNLDAEAAETRWDLLLLVA